MGVILKEMCCSDASGMPIHCNCKKNIWGGGRISKHRSLRSRHGVEPEQGWGEYQRPAPTQNKREGELSLRQEKW